MKMLLQLAFVFTLLYTNANAQKIAEQKESREFFFRITEIQKINKDSINAIIDAGSLHGITKGLTGSVKATFTKGENRANIEIGFASVTALNDSETLVLIRPVDKYEGNTTFQVRKGDYVVLKVQVPKLAYRSIFYELGAMNIMFNNVNNKSYYSLYDLLYNDSKNKETKLLEESAEDVREIYEYIKDLKDTAYNSLKIPFKTGRYAGKSVFDVMRDCKSSDIYTFLNFVKTYPTRYIAKTWKSAETFATWVKNGAYYSKSEIRDSVLRYASNTTLLKQFIEKNKETIIDEDFINIWISDALEEQDEMFEQSMLAARLALKYLPNDNSWGSYYNTLYNKYYDKSDYKKAILYCDSALIYFKKTTNFNAVVSSLYKKASILYMQDKNDESLQLLEEGFTIFSNPANKFVEQSRKNREAYYYRLKGYNLYAKGELLNAAKCFSVAYVAYKKIGDFNSIKTAISCQTLLAKIYKKQGETLKALDIYKEQLALYIKLNDRQNIASTTNDIALAEYHLSNYREAIIGFSKAKSMHLLLDDYSNAGYCQSNIGQAYWNLGKYDSAVASHQQAIEYRKIAKNYAGLGFSWEKIGSLYKLTGEKNKAFNAYDSASHYYTLAKDTASISSLLSSYGDVYYNDKQYQKAFDIFSKWNALNYASNNKPELANSLYLLAISASYINDDTSKKYSYQCLNISKEIGDKTNQYYALTNLGSLSYKTFSYDEGNVFYQNALEIAIEQKNKNLEASLYRTIGSSYSSRMDFANAIPLIEKSIHIYDSLGDKSKLPFSYILLGNALQNKGDFYEARKLYQKSIDAARDVNSRADVGYGYSALTFLYIIQGELAKAQLATDTTYTIFKELNNSYQIAEAYFNMGLVYEAKADGINAVKYYLMADSIYVIEKDDYSRSTCHTNIGATFYYQADYKKALKYFEDADKFLSKIKVTTEAHILAPINIGETYFYMQEYAKAEKYLKEGYAMAVQKKAGRMLTIASSFLGTLYYALKKYDLSEKFLLESFALAEKSNETDLYINTGMYLGKLYTTLKQEEKGQSYYNKTILFSKTIDNSKYTWMALYEYGLFFYNQNKFDSAAKYFKEAIVIVENASQKLFGGAEAKKIYNADIRKVDLYNKLVAALAKTGNKEDALYYADKSNNQAVKEQMEKVGLVTNDKDKAEAIKRGSELLQKKNAVEQAIIKEKSKPEKEQNKQLIASLESVKNVAEENYTNFIDSLVTKFQDLSSYFVKANPADFDKYLKKIPENTAVLLYVINDNQLFIFTATNKETSIKIVDLKEDINKTAARFLSILRNPKNVTGTGSIVVRSTLKTSEEDIRGNFKEESSILYNLLITPVKDVLVGKTNICIIPNQKLTSIPFQSLGLVDDNQKFHFLVEDYNIFYTNQLDIFKTDFTPNKIDVSFAIFGNPDKSLPGASSEAKNIAQLYPNSKLFLEDDATEAKAIECLKSFSYVHFATHGVLDYSDFNNSYLVFAENKQLNSDGKLTIKKINGLKLANDIIMLSACETAVSKEAVKGWYISPANAFLRKGAQTLIATLWKISDEATDIVETEFYKNLPNMTRSEALRKAQATLSQNPKYSHPFFWSAFVLYGEWR